MGLPSTSVLTTQDLGLPMTSKLLVSTIIVSAALCSAQSQAQEPSTAGGERLFRSRCGSCHSVNMGENRVGPHLAGILGRKAGSVAGARYSKALTASGFAWDEDRLQAYLNNPRQVVPGTTMSVSIRDAAQRTAIIEYLRDRSGG
ncbi:c-type cytochrome [Ensifer aridi]|uniref:c-type cytochrome n=2 Tax=Ensifer aridi TaxID=1708715 RepID=UPI0030B8119B